MILNDDVVPIRKRDSSLPAALATILDKALATRTNDRYQNAADMLAAIKGATDS